MSDGGRVVDHDAFMEDALDSESPLDDLLDHLLKGGTMDLERYVLEHRLDVQTAEQAERLVQLLRGPREGGSGEGSRSNVLPMQARLGDYRLMRVLGQGGMGTVHLAEQTSLARLVALKTLRPELSTSENARERFTREARAIAKVRHENIVTIYEAGEVEGVAYIAMELLPGADLLERIRGVGARIPVSEAVRAARDVARALACAHAAGIVHRDVKPSNIRITPEGRTVLVDFGLAQAEDWQTLTQQGQFRGTPHYAAPEQIDSSLGPVDERSDVYSLGATLYECVTGRAPFSGSSTQRLFHQVLSREAPAPRSLAPSLSRDLDTVIRKAMARERSDRYATAAELAEDLDALLDLRPVRARPLGPGQRFTRFLRRRPAVATASLLALLLFLVVPTAFALFERATVRRILRLSDVLHARELLAQVDELWPRREEMIPALEQWLVSARELAQRAEWHRSTLRELERDGSSGDAPLAVRWQIEASREIVGFLDELPARIREIEDRTTIARTVREATILQPAASWKEATASIAILDVYQGLPLAPQVGLVPLEPDPESGLWEFLLWETGEAPVRDPESGRWIVDDSTGIVFVLLPGGTFEMGAQREEPDGPNYDAQSVEVEGPVHAVTLSPFFLSKYEMTQGQWQRLAGSNPSYFAVRSVMTSIDARHPVEQVSWFDCVEQMERLGLVLPSEAQWEYACRAGTATVWGYGDELDDVRERVNIADEGSKEAFGGEWEFEPGFFDGWDAHCPVGTFPPDAFGMHEMHGNVWEWCLDGCNDGFYASSAAEDPVCPPESSATRVMRGGSFSLPAAGSRTAHRSCTGPSNAVFSMGLRPARAVAP